MASRSTGASTVPTTTTTTTNQIPTPLPPTSNSIPTPLTPPSSSSFVFTPPTPPRALASNFQPPQVSRPTPPPAPPPLVSPPPSAPPLITAQQSPPPLVSPPPSPPPPPPPRPPLIHPRGFPGFPGGLQLPLGELQSVLKERFSFSSNEAGDVEEDTPIMTAASEGDWSLLTSLLVGLRERVSEEDGVSEEDALRRELNKRNRFGCTALRLAARAGHPDCLEALIQSGADVNLSDVKAQTPLFIAIASNHLQCARLLLEAGAHPDGSRDNLSTPLYMCANAGWLEGLVLLIEWGASLNRPPYHSASFLTSPLHIALAYGNKDCFEALLLAGADPDHLCERTRAEKWEKLQKDIPRFPSPQRVRPLTCPPRGGLAQLPLYHVAIRHGRDVEFLKQIFEFGANPCLKDDKGQAANDMENAGQEQKEFLQQIQKTPHSLLSLSRLHIRNSALGPDRLHRMNELRQYLPPLLVDFLHHNRKSCVSRHAHPTPL